MEVDLALSPLLWITETEDGAATVGVSYKVSKILVTDGATAGAETEEMDVEL